MNKSSVQIFNFQNHEVRTELDENNNAWFSVVDVCKILDITQPDKVAIRLDKDDRITITVGVKTGVRKDGSDAIQKIKTNFVNESGLYQIIFQSRKPAAKQFKKWITSEVIPSIRKTGKYEIEPKPLEDLLIEAGQALKEEKLKRELAEKQVKQLEPKADGYDKFLNADGSISMSNLAKLLKEKDINMGRNKLFEYLRNKKVLMISNNNYNQPYQKYVDQGYFIIHEKVISHNTKPDTVVTVTTVTPKGIDYIYKIIKKDTLT